MSNIFDVDNSSLESSVKAYHKKVVEPLCEQLKNTQDGSNTLPNNVITKENIGEQSVKYAESAGMVDWTDITNKPSNLPSSDDPSATTDHSHANKLVLDKFSEDDEGNVSYDGSSLITDGQYTTIKDEVDGISSKMKDIITKENIGEQSVKYAESAGMVDWTNVASVPSSFPAEKHTHTVSDITDFPESLPASDVPNWAKSETKPSYSWDEIQNKPTESPYEPDHNHENKSVLDKFSEDGDGNVLYDGNTISSGEPTDSVINDTTISDTQTYSSQKIESRFSEFEASGSVNISAEENNALEIKSDGLYVNGSAVSGSDGKSAYEIWLSLGNEGSEQDFIDSLAGTDGDNGSDGKSAYEVWLELSNTGSEEDFINSLQGEDGESGSDGKSAYDIWLELGNTGTEEDFINSLKGEDGADGEDGEKGENGVDGKSAYDIWLELGNTGTEEDFINSLKGETGETGANGSDGESAYDTWLSLGNEGTEEDFINSLKGSDGEDANNDFVFSVDENGILCVTYDDGVTE